ncbi:MAG TPA: alpha/beta hydrolase [Caulobacteraceae bacterium]|nr:alpha/beta hydrolase [Caulobacteraceae bacterium]
MPHSLGILCLAVCLALATSCASAAPLPYDPGLLSRHEVAVGLGRRMNIVCFGKGSPTVVFEQGGEGSMLSWQRVEKPISALTRVCFYDRAGFGYSDPPAEPVTALSVTDDLHTLLRAAHVGLPVVIVGHSIGGFYATVYADRFANDVAGLVLVDPGFAGQTSYEPPDQRRREMANSHQGEERLLACAARARRGELRLDEAQSCMRYPPAHAPDEAAYLGYIVTHPFWYEAEVSASRNYFFGPEGGPSLDSQQEEAVRRAFGDMPLIVLTASSAAHNRTDTEATAAAFDAHWKAGHDALAARSKRGKSSVVPGSGHFIQLDQPLAVIAAIEEVVANVRASH